VIVNSGYDQEYMIENPACAICGRQAVDAHHCLYGRNKGIPELNVVENLLPLCRACHAELHAEGYEGRCRAWKMKCEEFGHDYMVNWHERLPMIAKENFE